MREPLLVLNYCTDAIGRLPAQRIAPILSQSADALLASRLRDTSQRVAEASKEGCFLGVGGVQVVMPRERYSP
jgi:hypothetical protein